MQGDGRVEDAGEDRERRVVDDPRPYARRGRGARCRSRETRDEEPWKPSPRRGFALLQLLMSLYLGNIYILSKRRQPQVTHPRLGTSMGQDLCPSGAGATSRCLSERAASREAQPTLVRTCDVRWPTTTAGVARRKRVGGSGAAGREQRRESGKGRASQRERNDGSGTAGAAPRERHGGDSLAGVTRLKRILTQLTRQCG